MDFQGQINAVWVSGKGRDTIKLISWKLHHGNCTNQVDTIKRQGSNEVQKNSWMFPKIVVFSPQIIPFVHRVFHYFHHRFWWFYPYFWKHPARYLKRTANAHETNPPKAQKERIWSSFAINFQGLLAVSSREVMSAPETN